MVVLKALNGARTQWYHQTAIVIVDVGFFTDAYDLVCISTISKLLDRIYYSDPNLGIPGKPTGFCQLGYCIALIGTLADQLVFDWLGTRWVAKRFTV